MQTFKIKAVFSFLLFANICGFLIPVFSQTITSDSATAKIQQSEVFNYHAVFLNQPAYSFTNIGAIQDVKHPSYNMETGLEKFNAFLLSEKFNETDSSFSSIGYLRGSKKEQVFKAGFHQHVLKKFYLNGSYRNITSPGFFQRQFNKVRNYGVAAGGSFFREHYQFGLCYHKSKATFEQNGGITTDSLLKNISNNQGVSLGVNLADAQNSLQKKLISFDHSFRFDKGKKDSTGTVNRKIAISLFHSLSWDKSSFIYSSSTIDTDFFTNTFLDTLASYDSIHFESLKNDGGIIFSKNNQHAFPGLAQIFKLGAGVEQIDYWLHEMQQTYIIHHASALYKLGGKKFGAGIEARFSRSENLKNASSFSANGYLRTNSFIDKLFLSLDYRNSYPSLTNHYYVSNHFTWLNDFDNVKVKQVEAGFNSANDIICFTSSIKQIEDYIYNNFSALPEQTGSSINIFTTTLKIKFPVLKHWTFFSDLSYTSVSSATVLPQPELCTYSGIYYHQAFFKNNLPTSFGVSCYYFASYYAQKYMPATGQFYLQQEQKVGDYPFVNFFVNARIKSAKLFFILEHLNYGWNDANYYYQPHQPTPGRVLKIGIDWTLSERSGK